jgi:hypothetical protein
MALTICPDGHDSVRGDFCDVCGTRMGGTSGLNFGVRGPFAPLVSSSSSSSSSSAPAGPRTWSPPEPVSLDESELCDLLASLFEPAPPAAAAPPPSPSARPTVPMPSFTPVTWTVQVAADRVYYDRMKALRSLADRDVTFPAHVSERRIPLTGKQMRIGRRSAARDFDPEIDTAGPPADPGISRLHAFLIAAPDGTWAVIDPGSANGTHLNGRKIAVGDLITLKEGDRINLGAWTAITVQRG